MCYSGGREVRREFVCVVHVMSVLCVLQWREGGTERVCVCCACNERSVCVTVEGVRYGESLCVLCM